MMHNGNRYWLYPGGWIVRFGIGPELFLQAKIDGAEGVVPWILGPHDGVRLTHGTEGVLHCARSDGPFAGGNGAGTVPGGKDLEERYGVAKLGQVGRDTQFGTEGGPPDPMTVCGEGAVRNDAGAHRVLNNAEVSAESICGRGWHCCQVTVCG